MKIKEGYLLREVAGSNIVVPIGEGELNFSGVITLNDVGAFFWKKLEKGCTKEELLDSLLAEYEIDKETASSDIDEFVGKLKEAGLLE